MPVPGPSLHLSPTRGGAPTTKERNLIMDVSTWKDAVITVGQLRERIKDLPDDMPVIIEKDAKGNGYSPLSMIDTNHVYEPNSTWSGEVYDTTDREDTLYFPDDGVPVVLLDPVN